ncbi:MULTISPECIES: SDR family NAD(P)-dependent oxidoreductase [unclassified Bacillus (in: firmicutes)]|uniref:SDR family NAD(P)-dependent oxidoreductase n=1 Tax=unclassified Bacillus (in: firmicutes) TaxID=185979 RepID=UPI0008E75E95|nr:MULTISPECIES: SDR family oxidoreductase [unclassified Bacillus (in: firmicutes)]SFA87083.1 NAD(P)-dependent dehydrogenase, short-chain alcohol dehydrogenase family [Bacillus sp. UNCCL13]SFQ84065.1 NAD(P)-dependent dehydrogenase, short-chain alcohol dehydrogenase family [Bacillus sp. cl95]
MSGKFNNQTVIVTGASQGIGEGIAKSFAKQGAIVVIADVNEERGIKVQMNIAQDGGKAYFFQTDVKEEKEIISLMDMVIQQFGKIDILVNNAGKVLFKSLLELSVDEWDDVISTNLRSVFIASREAGKRMTEGGRIINMASTRAFMSEPNSESYSASKGGIVALTHSLAASLHTKGITVNCVSPGWIQTENYDELTEKDHSQHWSNRVGKPEDIAKACLYLADPENNFINGQNIIIDGGMTKKMIYEE